MIIFPRGIEISDADAACLLNDLLSVEEWVVAAIRGKVNNCKKRLLLEWQPKFFADPEVRNIPASEEAFIAAIMARKDYKTRTARGAELSQ